MNPHAGGIASHAAVARSSPVGISSCQSMSSIAVGRSDVVARGSAPRGTALDLFVFDVLRLSVDIDLNYGRCGHAENNRRASDAGVEGVTPDCVASVRSETGWSV